MHNHLFEYIKKLTNFDDNFKYIILLIIIQSVIYQIYTIVMIEILSNNIFSFNLSWLLVLLGALSLNYMSHVMYINIVKSKEVYLIKQFNILSKKLLNAKFDKLQNIDKSILTSTFLNLDIVYNTVLNYVRVFIVLLSTLVFVIIYYILTWKPKILFSIGIFCLSAIYGLKIYNHIMADIFNEKLIINEKNNNEISQDIQNLFNTIVNKDFNNLKKMKEIADQNIKVDVKFDLYSFNIELFVLISSNFLYYLSYLFISSNPNILILLIILNRTIIWFIFDIFNYYMSLITLMSDIKNINKLYDLEHRIDQPQIKIDNDNKLLQIIDFTLDTSYVDLRIENKLDLNLNTFYLLRGKSGSGKSTFIKILRNIVNFNESELTYKLIIGNPTISQSQEIDGGFAQLCDNIYYVEQFGRLIKSGSLVDIIRGFDYNYDSPEDLNKIYQLINITELDHLKFDYFNCDYSKYNNSKYDHSKCAYSKCAYSKCAYSKCAYSKKIKIINPNNISGGEQYRLNICRTLFLCQKNNKKIILMDEIDAGLDSKTNKKIVNYIRQNYSDRMILYITHESNLDKLKIPTLKFKNKKIILINTK
jgi:ABC-type lipoprotein export system ATPase subunit